MGSNRVPGVVVLGKIDERKKKKKSGRLEGREYGKATYP